jgi:hypothetical protein
MISDYWQKSFLKPGNLKIIQSRGKNKILRKQILLLEKLVLLARDTGSIPCNIFLHCGSSSSFNPLADQGSDISWWQETFTLFIGMTILSYLRTIGKKTQRLPLRNTYSITNN